MCKLPAGAPDQPYHSLAIVRILARMAFFPLFCILLYLSVKPNPAIQEVGWIPKSASVFFDLHDDWKNAAGFGALAFLMYLGWPLDRHGEQSTLRVTRAFQIAFCCLTVVFMELLQLLIPSRHCDWKDMIWGSLGVCLALIPALVLRRFLHAAGGAL